MSPQLEFAQPAGRASRSGRDARETPETQSPNQTPESIEETVCAVWEQHPA